MVDNLDLKQIRNDIAKYTYSNTSKKIILASTLEKTKEDVILLQNRVLEIENLLEKKELTLNYVDDISFCLEENDINLNLESLVTLSSYLKQVTLYIKQLENNKMFNSFNLSSFKHLIFISNEIDKVITKNNEINFKHPVLKQYLEDLDKTIEKRSLLTHKLLVKYSDIRENNVPLNNNDRQVLSIKYGNAARLDGIIVGSSKSGKTALFEPKELIEQNNLVVLKKNKLDDEINKLLNNLYHLVKTNRKELNQLDKSIQDILVLIAKSRYCTVKKFNKVKISDDNTFNLINAHHPLIENSVGINLFVDKDTKALVISGPNAGGKTVSLKTIALSSLLLRLTGLTLCSEESCIPLFSKILFDIGDDQNILLHESTFSSHLKNINNILNSCDENSLVLFDELCSGTSNSEAVALSKAIIQKACSKALLVCVTTHFDNLKLWAYKNKNCKSIATGYDTLNKKNTYDLLDNFLGESHALLLASSYLDKDIVENASSFLSTEDKSILDLLTSLEQERDKYNRLNKDLENIKTNIECEKKTLEKKVKKLNTDTLLLKEEYIKKLEDFKEKIKKEAKENINKSVSNLNKEVNKTREDITIIKDKLYKQDFKKEDLKIGSYVILKGQNTKLKIVEINKNNYTLASSSLKLKVKFNDIQSLVFEKEKEEKVNYSNFVSKTKAPLFVLDLRGYFVSDAINVIDKQIEDCILHNLESFSIIHGLGEGKLSQGINKYLSENKNVKSFNFAKPEDGGFGKTYVYI